jgi:hypothetical protein
LNSIISSEIIFSGKNFYTKIHHFFSSINRDLVCLIWTQKKISSFSLSFNLSISLCFEMDPNNYHFNTQNSSNYPLNYQNPNNYQDPNQISNYQNPNNYQDPNQFPNQRPQNIQNFGMPPNFNHSSSVPNFHPYYGAMMRFPSPPFNGYMPNPNENFPRVVAPEFPGFSTQISIGGMSAANEVVPSEEDSTPKSKKTMSPPWSTDEDLVLISGWIRFGTDAVVGRNQKGEAYWGQVAEYCNEHCSFNPPREVGACRNRFNYMNRILGKWVGAYDGAKRMQASGWSENDILSKAQELYAEGKKNVQFTYFAQWQALRDQPRFVSLVGGNIGSGSSGSKRSHESDACGSNTMGSIARPMGREAAKKKAKKKSKEPAVEVVEKEFVEYTQVKEKEVAQLEKLALIQQESIQLRKMELYAKLCSEENLDDRRKQLLMKLSQELFGN